MENRLFSCGAYRSVSRILSARLDCRCPGRGDHHLSGTTVTSSLERSTRAARCLQASFRRATVFLSYEKEAALLDLAPRGVYLAAVVTHDAGGLLPHPFTLDLCPYGPSAGLLSVALAVTIRLPE